MCPLNKIFILNKQGHEALGASLNNFIMFVVVYNYAMGICITREVSKCRTSMLIQMLSNTKIRKDE